MQITILIAHKEKRHAEDSGHFLQFMHHYQHKEDKGYVQPTSWRSISWPNFL